MNSTVKEQLINLDYQTPTELCEIMLRNKSDKSGTHNYTFVYNHLFAPLRDKPINIMECGMGSNNPNIFSNMGLDGRPGASHYGWLEYFPQANVYGCDIDKDININIDRLKTFYCDQTKPETIKAMWDQLPQEFDIIIDDGWHVFPANQCFLENSFYKLKSGGIYIIEDIYAGNCSVYKKYFKENGIKNNIVMQLPFRSAQDNCLAIILKD